MNPENVFVINIVVNIALLLAVLGFGMKLLSVAWLVGKALVILQTDVEWIKTNVANMWEKINERE